MATYGWGVVPVQARIGASPPGSAVAVELTVRIPGSAR